MAFTDVRADRVTPQVWFSLEEYFCGEAVLLFGFCGRGCALLSTSSQRVPLPRPAAGEGGRGNIGGEHFGENGDQRSERWRKNTAG